MKLQPICNCKEDKKIMGNWNGEMIWQRITKKEIEHSQKFPFVSPFDLPKEIYNSEQHQNWLDKQSGVNE